jgi:ubiquinone biosynthesis protein UbiJ
MLDPASALGRGIANHLLAGEDWAREKLRAHAGRAFALSSGPVALAFVVCSDGSLDAARANGPPPDAEFHVSPLDVPALLADPSRWDTLVTGKGDAALAATLKELARTLPWFVERAFAKAFGPILGQRFADAGRRLLAFPDYAGERFAGSVASYARDEAGLLARGDEARLFAEQNAALALRVEAVASRLSHLEAATPTATKQGQPLLS